ncbi:MAG: hypothetical protein J4G12_02565 [Gemmatimonadetes bacterium]|nr:hypothetical protein [Gemmatimonadota bacterium]
MRGRVYLGIVVLILAALGVLGAVASRQASSLDALERRDELRRQNAQMEERVTLVSEELRALLSRRMVSSRASELLGMRTPSGNELVLLPVGNDR